MLSLFQISPPEALEAAAKAADEENSCGEAAPLASAKKARFGLGKGVR
jgi:hypothetical protein